jgi:hypothetical protein
MVAHFDSWKKSTPCGRYTRSELATKMINMRDQFNFKKFSRSTNPRTAPAYHAKLRAKDLRDGFEPNWAYPTAPKFISQADGDSFWDPRDDEKMLKATMYQDKDRKESDYRLPSEFMLRTIRATNSDSALALPAPTTTGITSVAGVRALGYAPQIVPNPGTVIHLEWGNFARSVPIVIQ